MSRVQRTSIREGQNRSGDLYRVACGGWGGGDRGGGILTFDWVREIADTMPRAKGG